MARNIELKARCSDLARAEAVCRRLGAAFEWTRRQIDVYFRVPEGRLKLRVEEPGGAALVAYQRPNAACARASQYELTAVADPDATLADFESRHGIVARVVKTRTLYLIEHVRIHLDTVDGLGTFIELEAVMGRGDDDGATHAFLDRLCLELGMGAAEIIGESYCDLLADAEPKHARSG